MDPNIVTIASLSESSHKYEYCIKARVTAKSTIRTWNNDNGEGKLFSMDLVDETGEIRATAFQQEVNKFHEMIKKDKVYYISNFKVKPANKQYSKMKNDYEIKFGNDTVVKECTSIPTIKHGLVKISTIGKLNAIDIVDVFGVCRDARDLSNIGAPGDEIIQREITLVDQSNVCISLILWGEEAKSFDRNSKPVVLVKNACISDYGGGKILIMIPGSVLELNPDISEGHRLRGWFELGGGEHFTRL